MADEITIPEWIRKYTQDVGWSRPFTFGEGLATDKGGAMNWDAMTGRERDALTAECMGWIEIIQHKERRGTSPDFCQGVSPRGLLEDVPDYTADHAAVAALRAEVARRKMEDVFVDKLMFLLESPQIGDEDPWKILNATPEQQCHAFVRACGSNV